MGSKRCTYRCGQCCMEADCTVCTTFWPSCSTVSAGSLNVPMVRIFRHSSSIAHSVVVSALSSCGPSLLDFADLAGLSALRDAMGVPGDNWCVLRAVGGVNCTSRFNVSRAARALTTVCHGASQVMCC